MKRLILIPLLLLTGCSSGTTSLNTDLGNIESVSSDMGRYTAWAMVEAKKVEAIQAIETPIASAEAEVTVILDNEEKIRAWSQYKTTVALKDAVVAMAKALTPKSKALDPTPMPKGAVAEGIDSATGFVVGLANSPTAIASAVGVTAVQMTRAAVSGAGDKTIITGNENSTTSTKTKTTNINHASGVESAVNTGDQSKTDGAMEEVAEEVAE